MSELCQRVIQIINSKIYWRISWICEKFSIQKNVFSSCHERRKNKNFWVPMRNRTSDLRIPRSDALPPSHRDSTVSEESLWLSGWSIEARNPKVWGSISPQSLVKKKWYYLSFNNFYFFTSCARNPQPASSEHYSADYGRKQILCIYLYNCGKPFTTCLLDKKWIDIECDNKSTTKCTIRELHLQLEYHQCQSIRCRPI